MAHFLQETIMDPKERMNALNKKAEVVLDVHIPARRYYRSGNEMMRMASIYEEEGCLEDAYVLYLKYSILFIDKIREHPEFSEVPANVKSDSNKHLKIAIAKAEELRQKVDAAQKRRYKEWQELQKREAEDRKKREIAEEERRKREKEALELKLTTLAADRERDFEMRKAKRDAEERERKAREEEDERMRAFQLDWRQFDEPPPAYPVFQNNHLHLDAQTVSPTRTVSDKPSVDRATKPNHLLATRGLRTVVVPDEIIKSFLDIASPNTVKNIETCAILSGCLQSNKLIVTDMLIPKQSGTPDSCTTSHEEEIFDYQDNRGLITLGWIHTHPTQTAFLSSVDLHSHCSYQMMLPEAIAIVCAPKHQETRVFMLTPENGVQYIANCRETGFHLHDDPNLFQDAPHVLMEKGLPLVINDFRR